MTSVLKSTVLLTSFIILNSILKVVCNPSLIVTNDGPAVLGANVTFFSLLSGYSTEVQLTYIFDDGVQNVTFPSTSLNVSVTIAFPSDLYVEKRYCMNVTVEAPYLVVLTKKIAVNSTCFDLRRSLIGEILIYQGSRDLNKDDDKIAFGKNFTAVVHLYDPNNYLKDAIIDYSWSFDMDNYLTSNNSFTYNFTDVGEKLILIKPTATFPDFHSISGFFSRKIRAIVPVNNVTVSGNPFLHHGDFLKLNVSCLGTPNFVYCSEIVGGNVTTDNFTCSRVSKFNFCHFEISKFLTDGKYRIGIYVGNDVSETKRIIEIVVYNVSIKPILSTVIIPIICSLLTLIIIAIGISFYIHQRNQFAVEVADFDFQDESDSYAGERTFFEKIFDSFACRNCGQTHLSCVNNRSESDPLLNDELSPYA